MEHAGLEALWTPTRQGRTCAHYAASSGQQPMLQWIVEKAGVATLSAADGSGVTPVMSAAQEGHLDVVEWIVSQLVPDGLRVATNSLRGQASPRNRCSSSWRAPRARSRRRWRT